MFTNKNPVVKAQLVLGKATVNAAKLLGLSDSALAQIIGVDFLTVNRIKAGEGIDTTLKEGQLALLFVRLFHSLDGLVEMDDSKRKKWLSSHNNALSGIPSKLIETPEGLERTLQYLESAGYTEEVFQEKNESLMTEHITMLSRTLSAKHLAFNESIENTISDSI